MHPLWIWEGADVSHYQNTNQDKGTLSIVVVHFQDQMEQGKCVTVQRHHP